MIDLELLNRTIFVASNMLQIAPPKVTITVDGEDYVFVSETYEIRFNQEFIESHDELTIIGMAIHELRHCFQYIQIRFRDELIKSEIRVEDEKRINLWNEEFKVHDRLSEEELDIEIDAFAFMTFFMKKIFKVVPALPDSLNKLMEDRIKEFENIYK